MSVGSGRTTGGGGKGAQEGCQGEGMLRGSRGRMPARRHRLRGRGSTSAGGRLAGPVTCAGGRRTTWGRARHGHGQHPGGHGATRGPAWGLCGGSCLRAGLLGGALGAPCGGPLGRGLCECWALRFLGVPRRGVLGVDGNLPAVRVLQGAGGDGREQGVVDGGHNDGEPQAGACPLR